MSEVSDNFLDAFDIALSVDGEEHEFVFSDGISSAGRIYTRILCLWIRDGSTYQHTHSKGYNTVVEQNERLVLFKACDVPDAARLYANDFLDVDGTTYRIQNCRLKDGIYNLTLTITGTT